MAVLDDSAVSLAERFRFFLPSFEATPAPLYAHLAAQAADAGDTDDEFAAALAPFQHEPVRLLLPLRLFACVHRWVLRGELPGLAAHYPSMGGTRPPAGAWPLFRDAVVARAGELLTELVGVNQHNEIARAAPLSVGFLQLAERYGLPQRLLEAGASAGLLLRWDEYLSQPWYPRMFAAPVGDPPEEIVPQILERRGCDLNPVDPTTHEGALLLQSYVWADLVEHMRMLEVAIAISRRVPAVVERADAADWLLEQLAEPMPGVLTVVYHSMMQAACPPASLERMGRALDTAAERATPDAPLAYLRFESTSQVSRRSTASTLCGLSVVTWPGGEYRMLATADVNGRRTRPA